MKLLICGVTEAEKILTSQPRHWNVISIAGPAAAHRPNLARARDSICLEFDDLDDKFMKHPKAEETIKNKNYIPPDAEEIRKGMEFGRKYWDGPLLIHCHAGISRSTAIGFLILFDKFREVNFAIDYLYKTRDVAIPNDRIVRLGLKSIIPSKSERLLIWEQIKKHPKWRTHPEKEYIIR